VTPQKMLFNNSPLNSVYAHKHSENAQHKQLLPFCVNEVQHLPLSVIE
jgi:hypothetical protein